MINRKDLARLCSLPEKKVPGHYGIRRTDVGRGEFYAYQDNGADVLFVAHLDTVCRPHERKARYVETEAGPVVYSRALDDRLGAYIGLHLLPELGITVDVLLTTGEERGRSTAIDFATDKQYRYAVEFDRGVQSDGTIDAVTYQYADPAWNDAVSAHLPVGIGSYSDIADLEQLGCRAVNWSAGYAPGYHGPRAHAYLEDVETAVLAYTDFHDAQEGTSWPYERGTLYSGSGSFCYECGALPADMWSCAECRVLPYPYADADWSNLT